MFMIDFGSMSQNLYKVSAKSDGTGPWFEITTLEGRIFIFRLSDGFYYCHCSAENHANVPHPYKRGKTLTDHMKKLKSTWCGTEPIVPFEVCNYLIFINSTANLRLISLML